MADTNNISISHRPEETDPQAEYNKLKSMCAEYMSSEDLDTIDAAYKFADAAHAGQKRKSGEPYIIHPLAVACILADLKMDIETITAAILHDTVEDCEVTADEVEKQFGSDVRLLVEGVTKITRIEVKSLTDEQAATIRKMLIAMGEDIRVIIIKLADRLHNMRTLSALPEDRQIFKARETIEIYAPIAHRLGIGQIKWELEDLAFYYLEPGKYRQVSRLVADSREDREAYLKNVENKIEEEMNKLGINHRIMGRPKHLYSIYQKMKKKGKGFSEIYDLIAVRLIVDDVKDCYAALGAIHTLWSPMPGRFKDYIAMPKHNMYQSLHTTVMGPDAQPLEVQIRTEEMHRASEYGVAAHWRYKEGSEQVSIRDLENQLTWLREMIDWSDDSEDSREFLKDLKIDLDDADIYVFTPNGDVKTLRAGSTPVDFAYAVHTEVGNKCVGAKVNGKIVPLSYKLTTGDRVEVMTSKSANPSLDWLSFVKTPSARNKIRQHFSRITRDNDTINGREKLLAEMRKNGYGLSSARTTKALKSVAVDLGYGDVEPMFVQISKGKESAERVASRLLQLLVQKAEEEETKPALASGGGSVGVKLPMKTSVRRQKKHEAHSNNGIVVKGIDDVLVRLSHCCNPVPGDDIIGFVTRGRGVSVHRRDCPNCADLMKTPERIIPVEWEKSGNTGATYNLEVKIQAVDRMQLFLDVLKVFADLGANMNNCVTHTDSNGVAEMRIGFEVSDLKMIDIVCENMLKVDGVFDCQRSLPSAKAGKKKHR